LKRIKKLDRKRRIYVRKEKEITAELLHWAENQEEIRAMILTSSPTNPEAILMKTGKLFSKSLIYSEK